MSRGWKIWLGVLAAVAVIGGFSLYSAAESAQLINNGLAQGAPQQAVVAGWHTNALLTAVIFELAVLVVAVVSVAYAVTAVPKVASAPTVGPFVA